MKQVLGKDFLREILKNKGRFLSILFIVMLGAAFFSGIRSAGGDMKNTADRYYDDTDLMDIRVLSTMGMTEEDLQDLASLDEVELVQGGYSMDVLIQSDSGETAVKVIGDQMEVNLLMLEEGRLIQQAGECVADARFMKNHGYSIGDTIVLRSGTEEPLGDSMKRDTFTIVGSGYLPYYMDLTRGVGSIGDGSLAGFLVVTPQVFDLEVYTEAYVRLQGAKELNCYSEEYEKLAEAAVDKMEEISDSCEQRRYDFVRQEAQEKINEGKQEIADAKQELSDAKKELADGEQKLKDGKKELDDAKEELDAGKQELADAKKELDDGEQQLASARAEVDAGEQQLTSSRAEIDAGEQQLSSAKAELDEGKSQLQASRAVLDASEQQLSEGRAELDAGKQQLDAAEAELKAGEEKAAAGRLELDEGKTQLDAAKLQLDAAETELTAAAAELEAGRQQIEENRALLESGKAEIAAAEEQITQKEQELALAWKLYDAGVLALEQMKQYLPADSALLQQMEQQLANTCQQLSDGQAQLDAGKAQLESEKAKLSEGEQQLAAGEAELAEGRAKYEAGLAEYQAGLEQYNSSLAAWEQGEAEWQAGMKELEAGREKVEAAREEYLKGEEKWQQGNKAFEEGKRQYLEGEAAWEVGKQQYDQGVESLQAGKQQYQEGLAAWQAGKQQYDQGVESLQAGKQQYQEGLAAWQAGKQQYEEGLSTWESGKQQYEEGLSSWKDGKKQYEDGLASYEKNLKKWQEGQQEYLEAEAEALPEIAKAEQELSDAEEKLADLEKPKWYVLDRDKIQSCVSFGMDADRMDSLGNVFPVLFFLVAALVSLTAMTRMVEEQRLQIGTMKALGYGSGAIVGKYLGYALLATVTGAVIGVIIGEKALPWVIMSSYGIMYTGLPYLDTPINWVQGSLAVLLSVLCTGGATLAACGRQLLDSPAKLMRPEAPVGGSRILLERVGFLWIRFSFTTKSTLRNLFRYKKRFIMTIIGIGGCMALMLVGFGLRDSITVVARNQYREIFMQDATVSIENDAHRTEREELLQTVSEYPGITDFMEISQNSVTLQAGDTDRTAFLYVPEQVERAGEYVCFRDRVTGEEYSYPKAGAALSEKTASMLKVQVGDTITIQKGEGEPFHEVSVERIVENYVQHYCFISPEVYEKVFGETVEYNQLCLQYEDFTEEDEEKLGITLLKLKGCSGFSTTRTLDQQIQDMLQTLDSVIWVLIGAAALLAFVVLYNLNSINMTERKRELATLKVLGFYDPEVAMYVYRENILLTLLGIVAGCFLGKMLHLFTILTVEVDLMMFGRTIVWSSYVICGILTLVFSLVVNLIMYSHFKKIDMIESLKSVE
ncbi:MAG: ABC transporter permease [Lachnospiraceae bacterium]|nr:ABC transporter permease [Lachnospiraceae bacterium]